ncbi:U11/U12 snRNP 25 kDa protein, putative [Pediculus humanus corporis]|uniref:U11/U12 snRNP 25 kDa protein, putative n=1 Tax=Pediculus humanus subsp. corporis TaxID=121224 RepID=E0VAK1_PEDHC|nr:U11/U12 snRNP 25 kDa protein, putative [Pediculus humanus corporis]EEB10407.1 U11/U12 snRNP 25 kDa protein, putative [Pediculus humanus corporis]
MNEFTNPENEDSKFTHEQLMQITNTALNELLTQDSFLNDLPNGVTLEEVNNQIALQHGKSITINILREDKEKMPIIVSQAEGTVADLKKSIRKYITLKLKRSKKTKMRHKLISWKYIWKTYFLKHSDKILKDNNVKLKDIGIKNKKISASYL